MTSSDAHEVRKRSRGYSGAQRPAATAWGSNSFTHNCFTDAKSPPPLAHDRYQLADGMDESRTFGRQIGDYDDYFQLQQQRGQWSVPPTPATGMRHVVAVDRMETTPNGSKPWSILGLVGGVAGRLFQFCTVPFRGFQAGGGQRYTIDSHGEVAARLGLQDEPYFHEKAFPVRQTPGDFPQDNYGVRSIDSLDSETPQRPRMTKRLRTADNWVVVGEDGETESRPSTPRLSERRVPDYPQKSPSHIPRPASRASIGTPGLKRPSLIPVSRRSTMDRRSIHGNAKAAPSSHSRQRSYSRQSYGSPAMHDDKAKKPASPLPKESQRLINKVRREEIEEDARLRRMSTQMSAMLREAKEALGSKFEIEDEYEDNGGYGDGGGRLQQSGYFPRFS